MSSDTLKSFATLHDDYAFFEAHSSETEATLAAWLPLVQNRWSSLRALDFGAGSGSFTSSFLQRAGFSPDALRLSLIEPDPGFREQAIAALSPFSSQPVETRPLLDADLGPSFDLIFSHHVLYYVPDLATVLQRLVSALNPGGRLLLVQGGAGNQLNTLVWAAFDRLGEKAPYNYSEDTTALLTKADVPFQIQTIRSALEFPDTEANRWKILRFLMGEHLVKLPPQDALELYSPYVQGPNIRLESADELFVIDA